MHRLVRTCLTTAAVLVVATGVTSAPAHAAPIAQSRHTRVDHDHDHDRARHDDRRADRREDRARSRTVRLRDDCDPQTFNAALGEGACTGDGGTTFDALVASLAARHPSRKWRVQPAVVEVRRGDTLLLVNTGGEFHTFTEVDAFGPGCAPPVNDLLGLSGSPAADCAAAFGDPSTALPAGARGTVDTSGMSRGVHRFECMVHPWMTATVRVGAD